MSSLLIHLYDFNRIKVKVRVKDRYLIKIILIAGKKAIKRKWERWIPLS